MIVLAMCVSVGAVFAANADPAYAESNIPIASGDFNIRGGSIRYASEENYNGMRIHIRVNEDTYDSFEDYSDVGVLLLPLYNLVERNHESELKIDSASVLNVSLKDLAWKSIANPDGGFGESATDKEILIDLLYIQNGEPVSPVLYNQEIVVRGYMIKNGTISYTGAWGKSIADIALSFYQDPNETSAHKTLLAGYLNTYTVSFFDKDGHAMGAYTKEYTFGDVFDVPTVSADTNFGKTYQKIGDSYSLEAYDFSADGANVVKKDLTFKFVEQPRTITYDGSIIVKDSGGNPVPSGSAVRTGTYTAEVTGSKTASSSVKIGDSVITVAVNGMSVGSFTIGDEQITLNEEIGNFSLVNTMPDSIESNYLYASDPSVIYENGKYYMILQTNWSQQYFPDEDPAFIWELFEADSLEQLSSKTLSNRYCVMTLVDFATAVASEGITANRTEGNYAPEITKIGDYYYIVTSFLCESHKAMEGVGRSMSADSHFATTILRSSSLTSGWEVWCPHIETPVVEGRTWDTIDGVIYQENGHKYLVVSKVHTCETTDGIGSYQYIELKDDLSGVKDGAEWTEMFKASACDLNKRGQSIPVNVSDAPAFYKNTKGQLVMLWTTNADDYCVLQSVSSNGIAGPWTYQGKLYSREVAGLHISVSDTPVSGGHAGLVRTAEGQLYMTLHVCHWEADYANPPLPKRPAFIAVRENPTTGLLEWGKDPAFIELTTADHSDAYANLAVDMDTANYKAEFTVRKDLSDCGYVGIYLRQDANVDTKILLNTYNGEYAVLSRMPGGSVVDTRSEHKVLPLDQSDLLKFTILSDGVHAPQVYLNDVYNVLLTQELARGYMFDGSYDSVIRVALFAQGTSTERFLDYSFESGRTPVSSGLPMVEFYGVTVKDASSNTLPNGAEVAVNDVVSVTVSNPDKTKIAELYVNGVASGYKVVNATQTFEYTITGPTVFYVLTTNYPRTFVPLSSNPSVQEAINARTQGIDANGYLIVPNYDEYSATILWDLNQDAVFNTTIKINNGYSFGVRFLIGETEYRVLLRSSYSQKFHPDTLRLEKGGTSTNIEGVIDPSQDVRVKLIFDSVHERVLLFVNGFDYSDQLNATYISSDHARIHFYGLCERDATAPLFKDWSVKSGAAAVEAELGSLYHTVEAAAGSQTFVGMVEIQEHDPHMIFDATISGLNNGGRAGLLFSNYSVSGKPDVGISITRDHIYGGTNKNYGVTDADSHRLQIHLDDNGALYVYVDGVLKTGQYMKGFTTGATDYANYSCYVYNEGSASVTMNYHFCNERRFTSTSADTDTIVENAVTYHISEKIAEFDLPSYANDESLFNSVNIHVEKPNGHAAGIAIKDDKGNISVIRLDETGCHLYRASDGATSGKNYGEMGVTVDHSYDLLLEFQKNHVVKVFTDLKTASAQFLNANGTKHLGLAIDATKLEFYLVWTDPGTSFVY